MVSELAYVFWHWPRPGVSVRSYERKLSSFQSSLKSSGPTGLVDALSYRVDGLPWGPRRGPLYEDWYVVEGFSALGWLNDGALAGRVKGAHDSIAKDYMKGAGGVFGAIRRGIPLSEARYATWIEKRVGTSYQAYYEEVASKAGKRRTDLWRRQMVLGPSPQFCIHSDEEVNLPRSFKPFTAKITAVSPA